MWKRPLAALAIAVAIQSTAFAEQRRSAPPPRAPARAHIPAPTFPPAAVSIPHQVRSTPVPRNVSANQNSAYAQHLPPAGVRRPGVQITPNNHHEHAHKPARPRAVHREVARRVAIAGGVLVLPTVAYYGAPVILDVPQVGYVLVAEEEYAKLYEKLSSSDPVQLEEALAALRKLKADEDAAVEAAQRRPTNRVPADVEASEQGGRDLSEAVFFSAPAPSKSKRQRDPDAPQRLY